MTARWSKRVLREFQEKTGRRGEVISSEVRKRDVGDTRQISSYTRRGGTQHACPYRRRSKAGRPEKKVIRPGAAANRPYVFGVSAKGGGLGEGTPRGLKNSRETFRSGFMRQ